MGRFRVTLFLLLFGALGLNAQYDGQVKHWNFDGSAKEYAPILRGITNAILSPGIKDLGLWMDGENVHLNLVEGVDLTDDFTIGFWFSPVVADKEQTIFSQIKQSQKDNQQKRSFYLILKDKTLTLKTDKISIPLKDITIDNNVWYYLAYTYDGFEAKLYLQGKEVYATSNVTLYNNLSLHSDYFMIGKSMASTAFFEGSVDEVKTYNKALSSDRIMELYRMLVPIPAPKESVIDSTKLIAEKPKPEIVEKKDVLVNEHFKEEFKGRRNDIQCKVEVQSLNIQLEMWDYDEYDEDRITATLNNSLFIDPNNINRLVPKKRNKHIFKFILDPQKINYITLYASDMGNFDSQNTVAIRLWDGNKRLDDIYKLVLTEEKNAVIEVSHVGDIPIVQKDNILIREIPVEKNEPEIITTIDTTPVIAEKPILAEPEIVEVNPLPKEPVVVEKTKEPKAPKEPKPKKIKKPKAQKEPKPKKVKPEPEPKPLEYITILDYNILDAQVVHSTNITLEITDESKQRGSVQLNVSLDEAKLSSTPYTLKGDTRTIRFNIDTRKESVITLESFQLEKNQKCRLMVKLLADDELVQEFPLRLEKYNAIIPVAFVPKPGSARPNNRRTIVVRDTALSIKVRDNSKVDGDVITIKHGGKVILENHFLTEEFHEVPIALNAKQENKLVFVPVEMGKASTENTAWVQIIANGKIIHEFSLRSQNSNQPATLTIIHESE